MVKLIFQLLSLFLPSFLFSLRQFFDRRSLRVDRLHLSCHARVWHHREHLAPSSACARDARGASVAPPLLSLDQVRDVAALFRMPPMPLAQTSRCPPLVGCRGLCAPAWQEGSARGSRDGLAARRSLGTCHLIRPDVSE